MCLTEMQYVVLKAMGDRKRLPRDGILKRFPEATQKDLSRLVGEGFLKGDGELYHRTAEGTRAVRRGCFTPKNQ